MSVAGGRRRRSPPCAPGGACAARRRRWASAWTPPTWSRSRRASSARCSYGTASSALGAVVTPATVAEWGPAVALVALRRRRRAGAPCRDRSSSPSPDVPSCSARRCARRGAGGATAGARPGAGAGGAAVVAGVALVGLAGEGRGIDAGRRGRARGRRWRCSASSAWPARGACSARRAGRGRSASRCPPRWPLGAALVAVAQRERDRAPGRAVVGAVGLGAAARVRRAPRRRCSRSRCWRRVTAARRRGRRARLRALPDRAPRRARRGAQRSDGVGVGARRAHRPPVAAARRGTRAQAPGTRSLRAPRHPELAIPWRDATSALRRAPAHARQRRAGGAARRRSPSRRPTARRPRRSPPWAATSPRARCSSRCASRSTGRAPRGCSCAVPSAASCSATSPCRSP